MLNRRSFLISAGSLAFGQFLSSCSQTPADLRILFLAGSLPLEVFKQFRAQDSRGKNLDFQVKTQLKDIFKLLQTWQDKNVAGNSGINLPLLSAKIPTKADLVTLGDYWLKDAIAQELIQPLPLNRLPSWSKLPPAWQKLVQRDQRGNLQENNLIWGAPYRWGSTMIVYDRNKLKKFDWKITDWQDLWREELKERISIINQPREVIGLTLKKLGYSYNTKDLSKITNLSSQLSSLNRQIKYYSSSHYLQPLILGDVWVSVGWSPEIIPLLTRYPHLQVVVPNSGTALWTDLWVQPKQENANFELISQWIDFCWQTKSTNLISLFTPAASPLIYSLTPEELSPDISGKSWLYLAENTRKNSEFLEPLSTETSSQYEKLWQEIIDNNS